MGLDLVELAIRTEESFGITIDDRDAEQITTVGGLYRYVLKQLEAKGPSSSPCKSAAVFYRLRRALGQSFGIERERVRPTTEIEDFLAQANRRSTWLRLRDQLGLELPGLVYPEWFGLFMIFALLLAFVTVLASFTPTVPPEVAPWAVLSSFSLLAMVLILGRMDAIAMSLPDDCQSVRGLVTRIVALNYGNLMASDRHWNADEVWDAVRNLVSEVAGVRTDSLTDSTSFVSDLGLD